MPFDATDRATYAKLLGAELKAARRKRSWNRERLVATLRADTTSDIAPQTLATYELGTRDCTVVRFVALCHVLNVEPHEMLARVDRRLHPVPATGPRFDLRQASHIAEPAGLAPLREWATACLADNPDREHVDASFPALMRLAELCAIPVVELAEALAEAGVLIVA